MFNSRIWTDEDSQLLLKYVGSKKKIEEIARLQKRTVATIESKLKTLAANMYFNEHLPYDVIEEKTGIKKESLLVKRVLRNAELNGSPKTTGEATSEATSEATRIPLDPPLPSLIQVISTENPFSINMVSSILISTITNCLPTPS